MELHQKESKIKHLCHKEIDSLKCVVNTFTAQLHQVKYSNDHLYKLLIHELRSEKVEELCQKEEIEYVLETFTAEVKYFNDQSYKLIHQKESIQEEYVMQTEEVDALKCMVKMYTEKPRQKIRSLQRQKEEAEENESYSIQHFLANNPSTEHETEQGQVSALATS